jgi:hypothetical protein
LGPEASPGRELEQQLAGVEAQRQVTRATLDRQRNVADVAVEIARDQFYAAPKRIAWLVASPAVLGALLLIFIVVAWGFSDVVEPSGTTSTALIVAGVLVLVPAVLAALRGTKASEHAQQVFELAENVIQPPPDERNQR